MNPNERAVPTGFVRDPETGEFFSPGHYRVKRAKANLLNRNPGETPKLERNTGDGDVGALQVQGKIGRRFFVRITSFRKRLLDEDNLCCKFYVDLLRYAGIIPGDAPGQAKIEVIQEKVGPKEPERTRIEVY